MKQQNKTFPLIGSNFFIYLTVMTKQIKTEILIGSTPERIWSILTDFENYPKWNSFITSVKGSVEKGNKITVKIKPSNGREMTFTPTVLTKTENMELSWLGQVLFAGLFDGKHKFELKDNRNGTTTFIQSEEFEGLFVRLFNLQKTINGFNEMNQKLKQIAEKR